MFELRTLVEAVYMGCCYDQLNVAYLASFETLVRRIQAIVDAFSAGPRGNPDWGSAKVMTNYRGPKDAVSPQLKTWANKKGKEEADLASARVKMKEARRGVSTEEAKAVADGALPSGKAGGKGKNRGGRGLDPPAPEGLVPITALPLSPSRATFMFKGTLGSGLPEKPEICFHCLCRLRCARKGC